MTLSTLRAEIQQAYAEREPVRRRNEVKLVARMTPDERRVYLTGVEEKRGVEAASALYRDVNALLKEARQAKLSEET